LGGRNDLASCTSTYHVLPLYKVSLKSIKPFRRSCTYKIHGRTDGRTGWFLPPNFVCGGINTRTDTLLIHFF